MEIIVTTAFMAFGRRVEAGEVIDLPIADAAYVIGLKRAEKVESVAQPSSAEKPKKAKK